MRCQLEPKSAEMNVGTIAAYRPYSGGMPASVANAIPCGSTSTAPAAPAIKSARRVTRLTRGHQSRNGQKRAHPSGVLGAVKEDAADMGSEVEDELTEPKAPIAHCQAAGARDRTRDTGRVLRRLYAKSVRWTDGSATQRRAAANS